MPKKKHPDPEVAAAQMAYDEVAARYSAAPMVREAKIAVWDELMAAKDILQAAKSAARHKHPAAVGDG